MKGHSMWSRRGYPILVLVLMLAASPAWSAELSPEAINSAEPSKKSLSRDKATPAGVRLQVLLDRAHFSPGEIDGKFGQNASKALRAYAEAQQLPSADQPTDDVLKALRVDSRPITSDYMITEKDVAGPFLEKLPSTMEGMKDIPKLSYTSPREAIAEKFHMSEQLLTALNSGKKFERAGEAIVVVDTGGTNTLIGFYPATVGSEEKPSPSGTLKVTEVSRNPTYRYNPNYHFKGVRSDKPFTIKPGPNNPVGTTWISLSAEGYGIHGTPEPSKVSKAESHGCVRLTNWDAERVAASVSKGTPVEFVAGRE
jgi:lipoprotein-anchoring transpeptidase ErfK/SrfK